MPKKVLVVVAHPDDEVLGCGGTIRRHVAERDTVHVIFLADGVTSRESRKHDLALRRECAQRALNILGVESCIFMDFPDNRLDSVPLLEIVQALEEHFFRIAPEIVYTHSATDLNVDHRIAHQATMTACRPMPDAPARAIYACEVLSSTHWASHEMASPFIPTRYVDITPHLETKLEALACYEQEMRLYPHARSREAVIALARHRGTTVGMEYAEAFSILRELVI